MGTLGTAPVRPADALPLLDRLRVLQRLRLAGVALVVLAAVATPDVLAPGRRDAVLGSLLYGVVVLMGVVLSWLQPVRRHAVVLFSALLLLDGIWLAWTAYLTGSVDSPLRYLILLHIAAVALVGSARAGLKIALWHSLLVYSVHTAEQVGVLVPTSDAAASTLQASAVFVVVLWLVTVSISALSSINERELRRRKVDLEALTTYAEDVERAAEPTDVARLLLDSLVETYDFTRGMVLAGPDGQLQLLASFGLDDEIARRPGRPDTSAVIDAAHAEHATQLVAEIDVERDAWLSRLLPETEDLVVVPLAADGRPLGALVLEQARGRGGRIPRRVVAALERSASYAALALRNAWLLQQVTRLAATDGLTKIANRRTFEATLEREVARATRNAEHVSLVMVDIDHFKQLNDTHGHQAGDEVLRNVAAALACECRDFDTPARYGGEEFAIVLPGCGPDEAVDIADRLRRAVSAAPGIVPITASAGVATFPAHAGDADTLVRAADEALYQSKHAGRNRTTQSAGVPPEAQVDALLRRAVSQRLGRGGSDDAAPAQVPAQTGGGAV